MDSDLFCELPFRHTRSAEPEGLTQRRQGATIRQTSMKMPSRRMPAVPAWKASAGAWLVLAAFLGGLGYWVYRQPYALLGISALAVIVGAELLFHARRMRRLAASREGEGICEFARSFERHHADTWILRAVYEELSRFLAVGDAIVPVRAEDTWEKDLKIDPEDLLELISDMAFRAQRSMDGMEGNPLWGKVRTVADMVAFLENQPRLTVVASV